MRSLWSLPIVLVVVACSGAEGDSAETADDANLTKIATSDVKLESKPIDYGTTASSR